MLCWKKRGMCVRAIIRLGLIFLGFFLFFNKDHTAHTQGCTTFVSLTQITSPTVYERFCMDQFFNWVYSSTAAHMNFHVIFTLPGHLAWKIINTLETFMITQWQDFVVKLILVNKEELLSQQISHQSILLYIMLALSTLIKLPIYSL